MKVLIVGAGAMGSLFGGKMKQIGIDVTLFNRPNDHVRKIRDEGLRIIERDGSKSAVSIPVIMDSADVADVYQLVILFVKSFATEEAMKQVLPAIREETLILSLQNGLGNFETIKQLLPDRRICIGGTGSGAGIVEPGLIAHRAWGKTNIGSLQSVGDAAELQEIASLLTQSGFLTDVVEDVEAVIWNKLLVNIAYNGLTAVTRLTNGDAVVTDAGKEIVRNLVGEAMQIAKAQGIRLLHDNPIEECIRLGVEEIGLNKSSMLTDVIYQRKTEIDSINGAIVTLGKKFGIPTPHNEMMTNLVRVIEQSYPGIVTVI